MARTGIRPSFIERDTEGSETVAVHSVRRGQTETRPNGRVPILFCSSNGPIRDHDGETPQGLDVAVASIGVALASLGVKFILAPLSAPVGCNQMIPRARR